MNPRAWFVSQWHKLHMLADTPHAIAGGFAIGMFFGIVPLVGLKTLLAILLAWVFGWNKIAAVIGVTLHDIALPFIPLMLRFQYQIGFWLLSHPHHLPPKMRLSEAGIHKLMNWKSVLTTGGPLLLGSIVVATPVAIASYYIALAATQAYRAKREAMHHHHDR